MKNTGISVTVYNPAYYPDTRIEEYDVMMYFVFEYADAVVVFLGFVAGFLREWGRRWMGKEERQLRVRKVEGSKVRIFLYCPFASRKQSITSVAVFEDDKCLSRDGHYALVSFLLLAASRGRFHESSSETNGSFGLDMQ